MFYLTPHPLQITKINKGEREENFKCKDKKLPRAKTEGTFSDIVDIAVDHSFLLRK